MIGEETYRVARGHLWTADFIYPKLKGEFQAFRRSLEKPTEANSATRPTSRRARARSPGGSAGAKAAARRRG